MTSGPEASAFTPQRRSISLRISPRSSQTRRRRGNTYQQQATKKAGNGKEAGEEVGCVCCTNDDLCRALRVGINLNVCTHLFMQELALLLKVQEGRGDKQAERPCGGKLPNHALDRECSGKERGCCWHGLFCGLCFASSRSLVDNLQWHQRNDNCTFRNRKVKETHSKRAFQSFFGC